MTPRFLREARTHLFLSSNLVSTLTSLSKITAKRSRPDLNHRGEGATSERWLLQAARMRKRWSYSKRSSKEVLRNLMSLRRTGLSSRQVKRPRTLNQLLLCWQTLAESKTTIAPKTQVVSKPYLKMTTQTSLRKLRKLAVKTQLHSRHLSLRSSGQRSLPLSEWTTSRRWSKKRHHWSQTLCRMRSGRLEHCSRSMKARESQCYSHLSRRM